MSPDEWQELLGRIEKNLYIEKFLYLGSLHLTDEDIYDLVDALEKNTSIKSLDLSQNEIGNGGAIALARIKTLSFLNLGGNKDIRDEGAKALSENETLNYLDLRLSGIGNSGAAAFAKNQSLTSLNLEGNQIEDATADALATNQTLRFLDLKDNNIRNAGAVALSKNRILTFLNLRSNYIGDVGAIALALNNKTLKSLDLSKNEIEDQGFLALAENETLCALKFKSNLLKDSSIQELVEERVRLNAKQQIALENRFEFMGFLWKRKNILFDYNIGPIILDMADLLGPTEKELKEHQDNIDYCASTSLSFARW
jgi:Leucine-rich repeat (LRR) protein